MNRFFDEYWMFAEALLERCSEVLGVGALNQMAASPWRGSPPQYSPSA